MCTGSVLFTPYSSVVGLASHEILVCFVRTSTYDTVQVACAMMVGASEARSKTNNNQKHDKQQGRNTTTSKAAKASLSISTIASSNLLSKLFLSLIFSLKFRDQFLKNVIFGRKTYDKF